MSYHKTPTPNICLDIGNIPVYADEDIVRAFCEKGLRDLGLDRPYQGLGPTTCETVWFLPRTYEKKIKNL